MSEIYIHPQQKKLIRIENGTAVAYKKDPMGNYKKGNTSATTEKLRNGYGRWIRDDSQEKNLPYFSDNKGSQFFRTQTIKPPSFEKTSGNMKVKGNLNIKIVKKEKTVGEVKLSKN